MALEQVGPERWKVTVDVGLDDRTGKRRRASRVFHARGKRDAQRRASAISEELRGVDRRAHTMTLAGVVDEWWALHAPTLEASSRRTYQRLIDKRVKTHPLARKRLRDVTRADIRRWYAELAEEGRAATAPKLRAVLRPALRYALDAQYITSNPADDHSLPKHQPPDWARVRLADLRAIIDAAYADAPVRGRALHLAALTGMRRGEVCGLRWSRVDLEGARLMGDRAVAVGVGYELVEKATKSGTKRVIHLDPETVGVLAEQLRWQLARGWEQGDGYVFSVGGFDEPLHPDTLTWWFAHASKRAGVTGVRLHDLRHWHASLEAAATKHVAGGSLADVQRRLGHRQLGTTLRYLHGADDDEIDEQYAQLRPSLRPELPPAGG